MKTKDKKELFTKTVNELEKLLKEAKDVLVKLKLDHQQAKLKNTRGIFNKRKEIATLMSIIKMKPAEAVAEAKTIVKKVVAKKTKAKEDKK